MTKREKVMSILVGGTIAVLLNVFLISFFMKNYGALKTDFARKEASLKRLQADMADRDKWEQKGAWIAANQPKLDDPGSAGVKLMEEIREIAKRNEVFIGTEALVIGTPTRREQYTTVPVTVETKSTWNNLIKFLGEVQAPEKFIVLESTNLKVSSADKTQMQGQLRIAKWYAPK